MDKIAHRAIMEDCYKDKLERLGEAVEGEDSAIADVRVKSKGSSAEAEKSMGILNEFYGKITRFWRFHRGLGSR